MPWRRHPGTHQESMFCPPQRVELVRTIPCLFTPHLYMIKDADAMTSLVSSGTKVLGFMTEIICACTQKQHHSNVWISQNSFHKAAYLPSGSLKVKVMNLLATMNMKITQKHAANRSHWWCMLSHVSHSVILPGKQAECSCCLQIHQLNK